ncbi:MAG: hypothetical protein R2724_09415 [Bryobacterales bacterium]
MLPLLSLDSERLAAIPKRMQQFADEKSAARYVMLVAHDGKLRSTRPSAYGTSSRGRR